MQPPAEQTPLTARRQPPQTKTLPLPMPGLSPGFSVLVTSILPALRSRASGKPRDPPRSPPVRSPWTLHSDPLESPPHCAPNLTAPPLPLSRVRATSQPAATSRALLPACFSPRGQSHLRRRKPRPASPFSAEAPGRLLTAGAATPSSHGARRARAASVPAVRSAPVTGPSLCPPRVRGFCPGCAFCLESPARPRRPPDACSFLGKSLRACQSHSVPGC